MVSSSTTYSTFDAKNKLSELLDRVEAGEELTITRHGKVVARLVPPPPEQSDRQKAMEEILKLRNQLAARGVRVTREEILQWRDEGRRR